jgi:hypothetical protein
MFRPKKVQASSCVGKHSLEITGQVQPLIIHKERPSVCSLARPIHQNVVIGADVAESV